MSEEKKTQVYLGVISLVQQGHSLNELKVSEIAEASGIGKGTCYEYFSSKEEIIRETLLYTFHKEFDSFCGLLQFDQGFEAGFRQVLSVMEKALSQFSPFQTLLSSVGKRELKQYVSEEKMENIHQMIRLIDLLLDQALEDGWVQLQQPREYQRFVLIGIMQAYCFQITNPQLQISAAQAADYAWQGLREALA